MFADEDLLPISALQHWLFCRRQCALIHLERIWEENQFTAEGRVLHRRAEEGPSESHDGVRLARSLRLASWHIGLTGVADVVEFHPAPGARVADWRRVVANAIQGQAHAMEGWRVLPVETKRGRSKIDDRDRVQVAAQSMCLEDMLGLRVPEAAIFYGQPRRRETVQIDPALRETVTRTTDEIRRMLALGRTPPSEFGPKCRDCSLKDQCLPTAEPRVERWLEARFMDVTNQP